MDDRDGRVAPAERAPTLELTQARKMARSAHAYVRGNTAQFYRWLAESANDALPAGPPVWICGDCHLGNLGPLADAEGRVDVQIRDLDQTVIGNPAYDLVRLGLSLATAARGSDLPGVTTARMLEQMTRGYALALGGEPSEDFIPEPEVVRTVRRRALGRKWRDLAKERIKGVKPSIPLGRKFWPLSDEERAEIGALFQREPVRRLVFSLNAGSDSDRIEVVDAAYWMKGCSSLGNLRYAVLVELHGGDRDGRLALVDIKEAVPAIAPQAPDVLMPSEHADRVVAGARALSPNLGERMIAAELLGRSVVLRELMPQDLKLEIAQFTRAEAVAAARYLAFVVGRAHAWQMDEATRRAWARELERRRPVDLDAPGWLWTSVVGLAARHERGYLEHCRRYALREAA